jgi:hypothetical protein
MLAGRPNESGIAVKGKTTPLRNGRITNESSARPVLSLREPLLRGFTMFFWVTVLRRTV